MPKTITGWSAGRRNGDRGGSMGSSTTAEGSEGGTTVVCCSATKGGFTGVYGQEGGGVLSRFLMGRCGLVVTHLGEYARSSSEVGQEWQLWYIFVETSCS